MPERVGYIGLGDMGRPMATNLPRAGFPTTVFDLDPTGVEALVDAGATAAASPRHVAERSDIVCLCVRTDAQVFAVLDGPDGVLAGLAPGALVAIHSTVAPETVHAAAALAATVGGRLVDACVTGGAGRAATAQLVFLVGGDDADVARARPVFDASAASIVHAGPLGRGAALKIAINALGGVMFAAATEAYELACAAGVSSEAFLAAARANGQLSEMQAQLLALYELPAADRHAAPFQDRMRVQLHNAEKDLGHAIALANASGIAVPTTALVSQLMARVYQIDDPGRR